MAKIIEGKPILFMDDDRILELSKGEIVNFKRHSNKGVKPAPEFGGLFCPRIFGPHIPYTCACGIHRVMRVEMNCPDCGVPYIDSSERAIRYGHIDLGIKIIHPMAQGVLASMLGISEKLLQEFCEFSPTKSQITFGVVPDIKGKLYAKDGERYKIDICKGEDIPEGHCITPNELYTKLKELDIDGFMTLQMSDNIPSGVYYKAGKSLYDLFSSLVLVTPPSTRDRQASGDRIVYHEDNAIYMRLLREKYRIARVEVDDLADEDVKRSFIKYESNLIQKYLRMWCFDGWKIGYTEGNSKVGNLSSKEGLFRGNLLGKRVDYSGRSVITAGPFLKIDEVGIPIDMVHELYKPHIIRELAKKYREANSKLSVALSLKKAKREHGKKTERVKALIEEMADKLDLDVFMNRAPSLHRYSVMGHKLKITYDKCIYFHPNAMKPYNADCDGDQLAVHIPLSAKAIQEVKGGMHFRNNLASSANFNEAHSGFNNEQIVGAYFLTRWWEEQITPDKVPYFNSYSDVYTQVDLKYLHPTDPIYFIKDGKKRLTSAGNILIEDIVKFEYDKCLSKKEIGKFAVKVLEAYSYDKRKTVEVMSKLSDLFFKWATLGAMTISYEDAKSPEESKRIIQEAIPKSLEYSDKLDERGVSPRTIFWDEVINKEVEKWFKNTDKENALVIMGKAGARVQIPQVKSMIIAKGLLKGFKGVNPNAIPHSLSDGLSPLEYLLTCGPAHRAFAQNNFLTPASGYLDRQLVNLCRNLVITTEDCETSKELSFPKELCVGFYSNKYGLIKKDMLEALPNVISIRTPVTCEHNRGLCQKCCGTNPASLTEMKPFDLGFGIGVTSAQTLTEKTTQLSLRGKHESGTIMVKDIGKTVDDTIVKFCFLVGAKLTTGIDRSTVDKNTLELVGDNFSEKAVDLILKMIEILPGTYPLWPMVIARGMSDPVEYKRGWTGLRSMGAKCENPTIWSCHQAITKNPSWLGKLGYGWVKDTLKQAIMYGQEIQGIPVERIMYGGLIHDQN